MHTNQNPFTLKIADAALVVVDMQERLVPAMTNKETLVDTCAKLVRGCRILGLPAIFTQQYTKGLGTTIPEIVSAWTNAESPVQFTFIDKTSFSVCGEPDFEAALADIKREQIILCGIESHVCVLQSALDLLHAGHKVFLAADAAASRTATDYRLALDRMAQAGAVVTSTESILFELLGGAKHTQFKAISNLVK